jgi:hypothetical protein
VPKVKAVVIHIKLFGGDVPDTSVRAFDLPHRGHGASYQDQKKSLDHRMRGQILLRNLVFPLSSSTVDHGNTSGPGESTQSTTEASGQAHKMGIIQILLRTVLELPPSKPKTTRGGTERVISVQHDAIYTNASALEKVGRIITEFIRHAVKHYTRRPVFQLPRRGLFSERSLRKSVEILIPRTCCI